MNERTLGWIGVAAFGALWGFGVSRKAPRIENDIHRRGTEALALAGIPAAELRVHGRDVGWSGVVSDAAGIVRIGGVLQGVRGVRSVQVSPIPRTPSAAEILEARLAQFVATHAIRFTSSSVQLLPGTRYALDIIADVLAGDPEFYVVIEGHTDSWGDPRANLELSQERAAAVRRYLMLHGIAPERLQIQGFGDTAPIADNSTAAGRRANRRIVFRVKE
jgi:outer membrane protein OmpA-like peptidoglycan-associated protein